MWWSGQVASRAAEEWVRVSVSWEHAYDACTPAAAEVLRALAALNSRAVTSPAVGAAVDLTPVETDAALAELARDGWLSTAAGGTRHTLVRPARNWLAANAAALVTAQRAVVIIRAFTDFHRAALDPERHDPAVAGGWLAEHRDEVLSALQACDQEGLRRPGTRLACAVWPSAGSVRDPRWWRELAGAGEALAVADRDPVTLADLLHLGATTFAGHGEWRQAEARWVRALAVLRHDLDQARAANRDRAVEVLSALGALYREQGRLSRALDAQLGLVDLRREAGDLIGTADALAAVAATMHAAGRLSSAVDYFTQADEVLSPVTEAVGASPELLTGHARILVRSGRALWEQGQPGAAKRRWSRALALVVDVDDDTADAVRALLATAPEDQPPKASPITG